MLFILVIFFLGLFFLIGIRIIRQTNRGVVETFGRYSRFVSPGFAWIFPVIQRLIQVNITEKMADIESQEIITEDNLNAQVDLIVYYQVKSSEDDIKKSLYSVNAFETQIIALAKTTARNVIGGMQFKDVNSKRKDLNERLAEILKKETEKWGVEVVRVEMKEIVPPKDVQETMNKVIKAENEKRSAIDFATAKETEADGIKRAEIKKAEGEKAASILKAEGQAKAFEMINKSFVDNAQLLKKFEITQASLEKNSKIILTDKGINPSLIIGELPVEKSQNVYVA